jgi:glycosyltransferase involved in cell wall biosynthesis
MMPRTGTGTGTGTGTRPVVPAPGHPWHAASMAPIAALLVSTSYPADLDDWRGLFIRHLVDALARHRDLQVRLWAPPGEVAAGVQDATRNGERAWLAGLMETGGIAHMLRNHRVRGPMVAARLLLMLRRLYRRTDDVDVLHVNWLQNALPLQRDRRPLLVTVLGTDMQLLRLPLMRHALRRVFAARPVAIHPNADWMVEPLQAAFGDLARVEFLPFGIDPAWYAIRRSPVSPARWIAVTRLTRAKLGPLLDWGASRFSRGRELHLFGPMQEQVRLPEWVHYHGPASPETLQRDWFPTATGLVTLSRHAEGRPQVMLEALAAGLPILATDIAAHASFLRHGLTGWLCDSPEGMEQGLDAIEEPTTNLTMGRAARDWVAREVGTWDDCAERYVGSYRRLIGS